jgi:hypothetical protein
VTATPWKTRPVKSWATPWARAPDPDAPSSRRKPALQNSLTPPSVDHEKRPRAIARSFGGAVLRGGDNRGAPHRGFDKAVPRMFQGSAEIFWRPGQARQGPGPEERWGLRESRDRGPTPGPVRQADTLTRGGLWVALLRWTTKTKAPTRGQSSRNFGASDEARSLQRDRAQTPTSIFDDLKFGRGLTVADFLVRTMRPFPRMPPPAISPTRPTGPPRAEPVGAATGAPRSSRPR